MTLSETDRERIVEAMARVVFTAKFNGAFCAPYDPARRLYLETAANYLDAALSAGLADALQPQLGPEIAAAIDNPPPPSDGLRELMRGEPIWEKAIRDKALEEAAEVARKASGMWPGSKAQLVATGIWRDILALREKETGK